MKEQWKVCVNDANYLISSFGRIVNAKTHVLVKPYLHKSRSGIYLRHCLPSGKYMTHILVSDNFPELIEKIDFTKCLNEFDVFGYMDNTNWEIDHKDGNTLNPAAHNLLKCLPNHNKQFYRERLIISIGEEKIQIKKRYIKRKKIKNV